MDSQSIMGCQVFRYRQRLHQSLWCQCCSITSAGCKRKGLHEYHPSLFSHRELTACLCSWGCKQLLEHPHGCSLGFSYTELLTWQRELKNNCISTCAAQIYLDFDVSVQALSSLYGDYFLTLIKGRWKQGEFFDTCYALHHIYIPAVMQYLPINILTEFLVTVKKIRWNYHSLPMSPVKMKQKSGSVPKHSLNLFMQSFMLPFVLHSSDRMAVSVSNSCFWCLIPYKLKDMEKGSFSAEKSLLPWKGSWHDGVFHITQGL